MLGLTACPGQLPAGALFLDGNGSYVSFVGTAVPSGGQSFTLEAWINPTSIPTGGEDGGQITFWGNQTGNQANGFRLRGPTGTRQFFWGNDHDANFGGVNILPDTTGPNSDGWHHLALTYNGTQTTWYWNGNPIGTRATTAGVNVQPVNHRIGARLGAEFFHGYLDEIRIWNTARSGADILATMNQALNGTEPNLVTYFDFEGNLGDRAGGDNNGTALGNAEINGTANAPIQTRGPRIYSFTASTNLVMIGNPVTLAWQVTNASLLSIDQGVGVVTGATNSVPVTPFATTTYTLTASNEFGVRTALATINVDPGIPIAHPQTVATIKNTPVNVTLAATDPNGNTLTYSVVTRPQHGGLTGTPPNLVYAPTNDYFGSDFFTFKVNDGTNDSPAATISLRIEAAPTPPTGIALSSTNISANAGPGQFLAALRAIDANPLDTHVFAFVAGPGDTHNALFTIGGNVLFAGPSYAAQPGTNFFIRLRATDSSGLSYDQAIVLSTVEFQLAVVINEINYNSPINTIRDEFIELYNPKATTVDLSLWRLGGGVDFVFPQNTVIPAGGFLVVAQAPSVILSQFGVAALGPWAGALRSEGETLTLRDGADNVQDRVEFRSEFPWPIAANGDGGSMELINPLLDNDLGSSWATPLNPLRPSPGRTNQVFAYNAAPNLRQVNHTPQVPASGNNVVITAKVTDPEGVASVTLALQVVLPGSFIPATLPLTTAQLNSLNSNPGLTNEWNPAFEAASNWVTVVMHDDGLNGDAAAGDDIYSVILPPQAHRTLVRYRITVTDTFGATRRAPFEDDPSRNFAYFVYDGIPDYQGVSSAVLQTLPVYTLITRDADINQCAAWLNPADQLPQDAGGRNQGRLHFNWEGAMVYDGVVYDHMKYRLRGANGRYHPGKRSFRFRFNEGHYLDAKDQFGNRLPNKWQELTTGKGQGNRGSVTYALNEVVNYYLWNKVGVPAPSTFHFHFRVVRGLNEADRYGGDFWGLNWAQEEYDVAFLEAHNLPKGNLYKLVDNYVLGVGEQRYQAPFAVTNAADFYNIENNLTGFQSTNWLFAHANFTNWYRYHAVAEAIRHYDVWPSCNKNGAWYFEPIYTPANNNLGRMWLLPYDGTDTWGPTWNGGQDVLHNGLFNDISVGGGDTGENLEMQKEYRNVVRELRDLLFQPDQMYAVIDAFAAGVQPLAEADFTRWRSNTVTEASYLRAGTTGGQSPGPGNAQGFPAYVQDMKNFMFVGGSAAWWLDRTSIGAGGWITRLDALATDTAIPNRPTVSYAGIPGFPINGLAFSSSAFADPQGTNTFAAIQWRVAEVRDTNVPPANPKAMPPLEWDAVWDSGELATFIGSINVPGALIQPLKLYRARVRHRDNTGRWSRWSEPFQFYPAPADVLGDLRNSLVLSEIMYHPPDRGITEGDEFEFLEFKNLGATALDLTGVFITDAITFFFTNGTVLAPGQTFLIVRNRAEFEAAYPGVTVNGTYSGRLDNGGERITVRHAQGVDLVSVRYNDRPPWPVTPDGYGYSLVLDDPIQGTYRPSTALGGSPGADDPAPTTPPIVINELLANSEFPDVDRIELFNPTATNVNIGGWWLSDDPQQPWKYRIPDHAEIAAGGYLVFDESHFNPEPATTNNFALSSGGDAAYLFAADTNGHLTGYVAGVDFGASDQGVSFGRHVTSEGRPRFAAQVAQTFPGANSGPRVGPIVITEIMYRPPDLNGENDATNEFIEIFNLSTNIAELYDPLAPTNTWQLKGGVDMVFPTNVTLAPGEFALLVNFDPTDAAMLAAFQAKYGVGPGVQIFGPYQGKLDNANDDVELQKPILLNATNVGYVLMDKVDYFDRAPWPQGADGLGLSLQRINAAAFGNDPINWLAAPPTVGASTPTGGVSPNIVTQPQSQLVGVGQPVAFSVVADGGAPLQYRWLLNGANLPGATAAVLQFGSAQPQHIGDYEVVVFNPFGSALSAKASLSVRTPAILLQQPTNVTVRIRPDSTAAPTTNVTFALNAYSLNPLRYQWHFNGVPLTGASNTSLTVTNVQAADWGEYIATLSDDISSISTAPAWLYPLIRPGFAVSPLTQSVAVGSIVSLSAIATGWPPPFTFEWRRGSTPLLTNVQDSLTTFFSFTAPNIVTTVQYRAVLKNLATPGGVGSAFGTITVVADTDGDGLPDVWEEAHGLSPTDPSDAHRDDDLDGALNWQEYVAGTNPTNSQSYLKLDLTRTDGVTLMFGAISNRTYSVQSAEVVTGPWSSLADFPAATTNREALVPVSVAPTVATNLFFRVVSPRQP